MKPPGIMAQIRCYWLPTWESPFMETKQKGRRDHEDELKSWAWELWACSGRVIRPHYSDWREHWIWARKPPSSFLTEIRDWSTRVPVMAKVYNMHSQGIDDWWANSVLETSPCSVHLGRNLKNPGMISTATILHNGAPETHREDLGSLLGSGNLIWLKMISKELIHLSALYLRKCYPKTSSIEKGEAWFYHSCGTSFCFCTHSLHFISVNWCWLFVAFLHFSFSTLGTEAPQAQESDNFFIHCGMVYW